MGNKPLENNRVDYKLKTLFQRPDRLDDPLYVITPVFNSPRFRTRWRLYEDFKYHVEQSGAILYTVEVAFGDRHFSITEPDNPHHLQLRTWHELWLKENAINLAVARLPRDWTKVAWVDADVVFAREDWANETLHALEHWPVVQMWSQLHDLDSDHEMVGMSRSFADVWIETGGIPPKGVSSGCYPYPYSYHKKGYPGAPGLAWAMRREAWELLGGLIDYCILGAGDWYMAHALTGQLDRILRKDQGRLADKMRRWQRRAETGIWNERTIAGNLGVVKGIAFHKWHGDKKYRRYQTREQILSRNGFDPDRDLKPDWQGLYQIALDSNPQLRRDLQRYFHEREEDTPTNKQRS